MPVGLFGRVGASGLFWGLLILFSACCCFADSFGVGGGGGILLYRDNGQITYWSGGASYGHGGVVEDGFNFVKISSGVPWFSTDIFMAGYSARADFAMARAKIAGGLIKSSEVEIAAGGRTVSNEGAGGFYAGSSLGVDVGGVEVSPSLLFARMKFGGGDFYVFNGKPDLPALARIGLSAEYEKSHRVGVTYDKFDLDILTNGGAPLFESDNYCVGMNYRYSYSARGKPLDFYAVSGVSYAEILADGALTPANQQYFLFPYAFYNITGSAAAFAGWSMLSLDIRGKYIEQRIKAGAAHIFDGEIRADANYKYRKFYVWFYGRDEISENLLKMDLAGTGIVFAIYSLESRGLAAGDRARVYFGFRKIIGYYWGMEKFNGMPMDEYVPPEVEWGGVLRTALLSGLSMGVRVVF